MNRHDLAVHAHLANKVLNRNNYDHRLQTIMQDALLETSDILVLIHGCVLERVTRPQFSRGQPTGRVFSFRDITRSTHAEARLRLAAKVFECSLDAIFVTGPDLLILAVNPVCERLTQTIQVEWAGVSTDHLFQDPHDPDLMHRIVSRLKTDGIWRGPVLLKRNGMVACPVEFSWVLVRNDQGEVLHSIGFMKDQTDELAAQRRIEQLAYTDVLTCLPNRLMLSQHAAFALRLAERSGGEFSVFFIDLDRFKNINDSLGNVIGDRVLVDVAQRIKRCLRDVDIAMPTRWR